MKTADYLFPRDLEVSATSFSKILIIGSCLSESYISEFKMLNPCIEIEHILFNNAQRLPVKSQAELAAFDLQYVQLPLRSVLTDAVIRCETQGSESIDWFEIGKANIDAMLSEALGYSTTNQLLTLVSNFVVPQGRISPSLSDYDTKSDITSVIRELNRYLSLSIRRYTNVYLADVDSIANTLGKKYFLDDTIYFFTHGIAASLEQFISVESQFSSPAPSRLEANPNQVSHYDSKLDEYFESIYRQIDSIYRIVHQIDAIKLVIFDLDNTLWRGVLGEHYEPGSVWPQLHGWPTGIWDAINQLRRRGIIVSLCSKNDEHTVIKRWLDAMPLGLVSYQDFVIPKINWLPKADNIHRLLKELSLTPKNVLFVDDSPVERESVRVAVPGIRVIGSDPFAIKRILLWAPETQVAKISEESSRREKSLVLKVNRDLDASKVSRVDFLRGLKTELTLFEVSNVNDPAFYRVTELVNKTNQFNTVGCRRSVDDYMHHWNQGGRVFAFRAKDKYCDYGLVGVLFLLGNCITQYVMSCRVLGMEIEAAALCEVVAEYRSRDPRAQVLGLIIRTERNSASSEIFTNVGFETTANPQLFISERPLSYPAACHITTGWKT